MSEKYKEMKQKLNLKINEKNAIIHELRNQMTYNKLSYAMQIGQQVQNEMVNSSATQQFM